jgi:hypothetical protein
LSNFIFTGENQQSDQKSRDIAARILADHLRQTNILEKDNFRIFRGLLSEKVRQLNAAQQWNDVRSWVDLLIQLTDSNEDEVGVNITAMLTKVVADIHLQIYTEAINTAQEAIQKKVTFKALIALFHALLLSENIPAKEVIRRILENQEKYVVNTLFPAALAEDQLHQMLLCVGFTHGHKKEISPLRYHQISYLLIRVLLEKFEQVKPWRHGSDRITKSAMEIDADFPDPIDDERRYYEMCCIYFNHYFLELKFQMMSFQGKPDINEIINTGSMDVVELFVDCGKDIKLLSTLTKSLKEEFLKMFQSIVRSISDCVEFTKDIHKLGKEQEFTWVVVASNVVINALLHVEHTVVLDACEEDEEDDARMQRVLSAANKNTELRKFYYDNTSEHAEEAGILKFTINLLYAELNSLMADLFRYLPPSMVAFLVSFAADKSTVAEKEERKNQKDDSAEAQQARCLIVASGGYLDAVAVFKRHLLDSSLPTNVLWKDFYGDALERSGSMDIEEESLDEEGKFNDDILQYIANKHQSLEQEALTKYWKKIVDIAKELCVKAKSVLSPNIDFASPFEKSLYSKCILLQIGCFCAMEDSSKSDEFIRSIETELKELQVREFKMAVQQAKSTNAFSIEALRFLLQQGVMHCKQNRQPLKPLKERKKEVEMDVDPGEGDTDEQDSEEEFPTTTSKDMEIPLTIIWMYRNLIEICASRRQAFDFFVEIENYLLCLFRASNSSCILDPETEKKLKASFLPDHTEIDSIISIGHSYTCTLIELDQIPLAELFLVKLVHLLPFASDIANNLSPLLKVR